MSLTCSSACPHSPCLQRPAEVLPDQVDLEVAPQQDLGQGGDSLPLQQDVGSLPQQGVDSLPLHGGGGADWAVCEGILVTFVNTELSPGLVEIKNSRLVCSSFSPWKTTLQPLIHWFL